jgi:hypothetical protein
MLLLNFETDAFHGEHAAMMFFLVSGLLIDIACRHDVLPGEWAINRYSMPP